MNDTTTEKKMWKRYTKDSVIADGAQCLILRELIRELSGLYEVQFSRYSKSGWPWTNKHFVCYDNNGDPWYPDVVYYDDELPSHLCIDCMSADEHPDLIKDC